MAAAVSGEISRRQFLAVGGIAAASAWIAPTAFFAQSDDVLVPGAFKEASTAKITVQALRRNIECSFGPGWKYRCSHRARWKAARGRGNRHRASKRLCSSSKHQRGPHQAVGEHALAL